VYEDFGQQPDQTQTRLMGMLPAADHQTGDTWPSPILELEGWILSAVCWLYNALLWQLLVVFPALLSESCIQRLVLGTAAAIATPEGL